MSDKRESVIQLIHATSWFASTTSNQFSFSSASAFLA